MTPKKPKSRFVVVDGEATWYDTLDGAVDDNPSDGDTILEVVRVWNIEDREPEAVEAELDDQA
jgi:hypothetical protein